MSSPIGFAIVVSAILAIIVILGAPFTMIIMGSLHLQDCPAKTYIPIFLIVSGKMLKVYHILLALGDNIEFFFKCNTGLEPDT